MGFQYIFDELHVGSRASIGFLWGQNPDAYHTDYSYDPNGNIMTLNRNGVASTNTDMDKLEYHYKANNNQLVQVNDAVNSSNYGDDIDDQTDADNYTYDEIGELKGDKSDDITNIDWTLMGKVKQIARTSGSGKQNLAFYYNPKGERLAKINLDGSGNFQSATFYMRDPQGNIMATYDLNSTGFTLGEQYIYGSSRLGSYKRGLPLTGTISNLFDRTKGQKFFELSNHLGNVLSVVSDRKIAVDDNSDGAIDYFKPYVTSAQDYYPFGMEMPGRKFNSGDNRFGFNGQEKDNEITGVDGSHLDFGDRIYSSVLGRFFSNDFNWKEFPSWSSYIFAANNPIKFIDENGDGPGSPEPSNENKLKVAHIIISYDGAFWGFIPSGAGVLINKAMNSPGSNFGYGAFWRLAQNISPNSYVGALGVAGEGVAANDEFSFFNADFAHRDAINVDLPVFHDNGTTGSWDFKLSIQFGMNETFLMDGSANANGTPRRDATVLKAGDVLDLFYEVKTLSPNQTSDVLFEQIKKGFNQAIDNAEKNPSNPGRIGYQAVSILLLDRAAYMKAYYAHPNEITKLFNELESKGGALKLTSDLFSRSKKAVDSINKDIKEKTTRTASDGKDY